MVVSKVYALLVWASVQVATAAILALETLRFAVFAYGCLRCLSISSSSVVVLHIAGCLASSYQYEYIHIYIYICIHIYIYLDI